MLAIDGPFTLLFWMLIRQAISTCYSVSYAVDRHIYYNHCSLHDCISINQLVFCYIYEDNGNADLHSRNNQYRCIPLAFNKVIHAIFLLLFICELPVRYSCIFIAIFLNLWKLKLVFWVLKQLSAMLGQFDLSSSCYRYMLIYMYKSCTCIYIYICMYIQMYIGMPCIYVDVHTHMSSCVSEEF